MPPTPIADMPTAEILELIELLKRDAYQKLSRIHYQYRVDLDRELRTRKH